MLPLQDGTFNGAIGLHASGAPLSESGRIAHPAPSAPIERSLVVGSKLYTLSYVGLASNRSILCSAAADIPAQPNPTIEYARKPLSFDSLLAMLERMAV